MPSWDALRILFLFTRCHGAIIPLSRRDGLSNKTGHSSWLALYVRTFYYIFLKFKFTLAISEHII